MKEKKDYFALARGTGKTGMMMEKIHREATGNKDPITVAWWMKHGNICERLKEMILMGNDKK